MKKLALGLILLTGLTACGSQGQPAPTQQVVAPSSSWAGTWEVSLTLTQTGSEVALSNTAVRVLSGGAGESGVLTLSDDKVKVSGSTSSGELTVSAPNYRARCEGQFSQKTKWEYISTHCTFLQSSSDLGAAAFEMTLQQR